MDCTWQSKRELQIPKMVQNIKEKHLNGMYFKVSEKKYKVQDVNSAPVEPVALDPVTQGCN